MTRCVIIDDERPARERVKRLLANAENFEIIGEADSATTAVTLIDETRPDLCFLDVQMPEGTGFDVLERITYLPHVIFCTAYDEYAVKAFEVNSLDYLLKPFSKARFAEALDRARNAMTTVDDGAKDDGGEERIEQLLDAIREKFPRPAAAPVEAPRPVPPRLTARRGSKIAVLAPAEILWFEAEETLVFACTAGGRYLVERTLVDLEEILAPTFFRCHRRYLVNLAQIGEIIPGDAGTYDIVLRGSERHSVPLSRRQARKLKELIPW